MANARAMAGIVRANWQEGPERDEHEAWDRARLNRLFSKPPHIRSEESGLTRSEPRPSPGGKAGTCDECHSSLYHDQHEIVCSGCGLVYDAGARPNTEEIDADHNWGNISESEKTFWAERTKKLEAFENKTGITKRRYSQAQANRKKKRMYLKIRRIDRIFAELQRSGKLNLPSTVRKGASFRSILDANRYPIKKLYEQKYGKINMDSFDLVLEKAAEFSDGKLPIILPCEGKPLYEILNHEAKTRFWGLTDSYRNSYQFNIEDGLAIREINGQDWSSARLWYSVPQ